jgi:hypothetical protein
MKKLILIAAVAFTACNSAETTCPAKSDSTVVDSCKAIDTTIVVNKVDTVKK